MNTKIVMVLALAAVMITVGLAPAYGFNNGAVEFNNCLAEQADKYGSSLNQGWATKFCLGKVFG